MTDDELEAIMSRCGPGRPALIEAAFQLNVLWRNMANHCGLTAAERPLVRAYIRAFYNADGSTRPRPPLVLQLAEPPDVGWSEKG